MAGADLVCALTPADDVEAEHQQDVLRWLQSTDDIYRRVTPAIHSDRRDRRRTQRRQPLFPIKGHRSQQFTPDAGESCALRWWTPADLRAADPARFDPLLMGSAPRFGKAGPRAAGLAPPSQPISLFGQPEV